jgi:hypothetical protein
MTAVLSVVVAAMNAAMTNGMDNDALFMRIITYKFISKNT